MTPLIPLAGGAALLYFLFGSKSATTTPGSKTPSPYNEDQGAPVDNRPSKGTSINRPTSDLPEVLRQKMADALGRLGVSPATGELSGAADADAIRFGTQVVGELDAEGFHDAALALRQYVDKASQKIPTPTEASPIAAAGQAAGLTKEQADYAARLLALERDPKSIQTLITWLQSLAPSPQRDTMIQMAQALALQLEAAQATGTTLGKIDQVLKATTPAEVTAAAQPALNPASPATTPPAITLPPPSQQPPDFKPNIPNAPLDNPLYVPPAPIPLTPPAQLSTAELLARAMVDNLAKVQKQYGVGGAKGKEDKATVKKFQAAMGLGQDGLAGPAVLLVAAGKGAVNLPRVYYWPRTATASTVSDYRAALEKTAKAFDALGRVSDALALRTAIAAEHGEGGINGPLYGAGSPSASKPSAAPAPKPAAPAAPAASSPTASASYTGSDPAPGARSFKKGDRGSDVKAWQTRLNKGTAQGKKFPAGTADGIFGSGTETATKAFQAYANLTPDGVVGPNTRGAAAVLGLW